MQEPVENGGRHDVVSEDLAPLFEGLIGRDDDRTLFVALGDELEEELGGLLGEREIAKLIDDQEVGSAKLVEEDAESAGDIGGSQLGGDLLCSEEQDAFTSMGGLDAERDRQVRFADTRSTDEQDVLGGSEELQRGQFADQLLVDLRLKAEVELMFSST